MMPSKPIQQRNCHLHNGAAARQYTHEGDVSQIGVNDVPDARDNVPEAHSGVTQIWKAKLLKTNHCLLPLSGKQKSPALHINHLYTFLQKKQTLSHLNCHSYIISKKKQISRIALSLYIWQISYPDIQQKFLCFKIMTHSTLNLISVDKLYQVYKKVQFQIFVAK